MIIPNVQKNKKQKQTTNQYQIYQIYQIKSAGPSSFCCMNPSASCPGSNLSCSHVGSGDCARYQRSLTKIKLEEAVKHNGSPYWFGSITASCLASLHTLQEAKGFETRG